MFPHFEIFDQAIYSYPLLMGVAWGAAFRVVKLMNARSGSKFKLPGFFMVSVFAVSWLGAKLFYLWTADFTGKKAAFESANFWLGGGFVFYGGLVFGLVYTVLFALKTQQPMFKFNIFAPALAAGHAIGRIGCFLAGCCYGALYEGFGSVHLHGSDRYPVQLMEAMALMAFAVYSSRKGVQNRKNLVLEYLLFYALLRFILEFFRGDGIRGIWFMGASSSQLISIGMVSSLLLILLLKALYGMKSVKN